MTRIRHITGSFIARLALGYVLVAVVLSGAWIWSLYGPLTRATLDQQERNLTAVAQSAALVSAETSASAEQITDRLVARTDLRMTIVAADGSVLGDSGSDAAAMENHLDRPEIQTALAGQVGSDRRVSRTEQREELYVAVPASLQGERVALRVAQPLAEIEEIASSSRRIGLILLAVSLAIAVAVAVRMTRAAAEPVETLSRAAERMAAGNLSAEVPKVPADLEVLSEALESLRLQMRSRLDALEAERLTLRAAIDGLDDAIYVLDGETIELANSAASALFRAPSRGWRGVHLEDSGLPAPLEAAIRAQLVLPSAEAVDLEPDPSGRALRLAVAPLGDAGGRRVVVAVSDVTERTRLDRVRRDFVANASHELKTPVAGIRLLAQSAESAAEDGDTDQALAFTAQIEAETERIQRLVSDLLDLSRLEALPAPDALTDVRQAVDNAVISHRSAAARKQLDLKVDLSAVRGADVFVAADPTDIAIALDNLIDNAIAYTDEGTVGLRVTASDVMVRIVISDTGPGIPAEHLPRIFERFYRIDRGRSRESGGTGLGLALVKHVVERSHGKILVTSEPGEGTQFTIALPRAT